MTNTPPVGSSYKRTGPPASPVRSFSRSPKTYTNEGYQDPNFYKIYDYPNPEEINPTLMKIIEEADKVPSMGGGGRTDWHIFMDKRDEVKEIDLLLSWIEEKCALFSRKYSKGDWGYTRKDLTDEEYIEDVRQGKIKYQHGGGEGGFDPLRFEIGECWAMWYDVEAGVVPHSHYPWPIAFVYYVNTPEGCAPTCIGLQDYKEIRPESGQVVFIDGHTKHGVPTNVGATPGRAVIAGLFTYIPEKLK